jgi:hypothetical protein
LKVREGYLALLPAEPLHIDSVREVARHGCGAELVDRCQKLKCSVF